MIVLIILSVLVIGGIIVYLDHVRLENERRQRDIAVREFEERQRKEEDERTRRERKAHGDRERSRDEGKAGGVDNVSGVEKRYGAVLGLSGRMERSDIKRRYRELVVQYHPDKVVHLGPKLRVAAEKEMKDINEAYAYFREKYGL